VSVGLCVVTTDSLDSTSLIVVVRVCRDLRYLLYYEYQPSFSSSGRRVCSLVYWPVTSRHYHDSWTAAVCRLRTQHWRLPVGQVHIQSVSQLTSFMKRFVRPRPRIPQMHCLSSIIHR